MAAPQQAVDTTPVLVLVFEFSSWTSLVIAKGRGRRENDPMPATLRFREANGADVDAVLEVLNESAQWLLDRGIRQWYVPFPRELIESDFDAHRVFVAISGSEVVATAAALTEDPRFWGDQPPGSWYIHRLARRRDTPGAGRVLLRWIEDRARQEGLDRIRLDCGAQLQRYYESAGYELQWPMSLLNATSAPSRSLWFCYEKLVGRRS